MINYFKPAEEVRLFTEKSLLAYITRLQEARLPCSELHLLRSIV